MSKSENNFFLLKFLLKKYTTEVIKYFFMSTHYRKNIYFDFYSLEKARLTVNKIYLSLQDLKLIINLSKNDLFSFKDFDNEFYKFMNDDFNIPKIYILFSYIVSEINKYKNKNFSLASKLGYKLRYLANIIGFLKNDCFYILKNKLNKYNKNKNLFLIKKINTLILERSKAREKKKWNKADIIRKKLYKLNVIVKDKKDNTTDWYFF